MLIILHNQEKYLYYVYTLMEAEDYAQYLGNVCKDFIINNKNKQN